MKATTVVAAALCLAAILAVDATSVDVGARSGDKLTQREAEARFKAAGVKWVSSGGCTDNNTSTCTNFSGIFSGTVDGAITLKKLCICELIIIGATEKGHESGTYSHANGYKLDFRPNTKLDSYIKNSFTKIATRSDGSPQWKSTSGNIYALEGNHWDVIYY